ncbi:MAG: hypothetical protein H6841_01735 [Planctomycetes bacterium]|nr:hypothetical protein [Planctomycetota bacterium]MCB9935556.1 hypothetical protein [Planctomycetota bacterium]
MKTARLLLVPALLAGALLVSAQEAEKPPFEFKVSGETAEDFKIEFVANQKPDQSSAKAVVETYAGWTDNRESTQAIFDAVGKKWDAALAKSMRAHEAKLLSEAMLKAIDEAKAPEEEKGDSDYSVKRGAVKVTGEKTDDAGVNWIEAVQETRIHEKDWETGEMKDRTEESKLRYSCVKGDDGLWRINVIEEWAKDWENADENGEAPMKWQPQSNMLAFILLGMQEYDKRKPVPALKQDSAEAAARAVFDWLIPTRDDLSNSIHTKGLKTWTDQLQKLFTEQYLKDLMKPFAERDDREEEKAREVESTSEGADGTKVVKFKPRYEWAGAVEIHVKQTDGVWKVVTAGYYEQDWANEGKLKFVSEPDVYQLNWR